MQEKKFFRRGKVEGRCRLVCPPYGSYNEPLRTVRWLYAEDHVPLERVRTEDEKLNPNPVSAALQVEFDPKV